MTPHDGLTDTIETPRLLLRAPVGDDAQRYADGIGDYAVARFLTPVPHPYTVAMAADWLAKAEPPIPGRALFIIDLPGAGLIGCVTMLGELGFWLARPYWGNGYMTEAASALLAWHFSGTSNDSVLSAAHFDNPASLAVQAKLGFVETGRKMAFAQARQQDIEHITTMLTRSSFEAKRGLL